MARIRTIKPEFPQSETTGRLSRDARLLFVMLWTLVDDEGRARAASRMLASLLYPYDDDARDLIDGWLTELEREGCVRLYQVDGSSYLEITNWRKHQKIDKPSASKLPSFVGGSPTPREDSRKVATDLGPVPRTVEGEDAASAASTAPPKINRPSEWFDELETSLRDAAGLENDPSPSLLDVSPIVALIDKGYDLAGDILPKLRAAKAKSRRGRSWGYYLPAITEGHAANGAIPAKPAAAKVDPQVWITEDDPRWQTFRTRWQEAKGKLPHATGSRYESGQGWYFPAEWVQPVPAHSTS